MEPGHLLLGLGVKPVPCPGWALNRSETTTPADRSQHIHALRDLEAGCGSPTLGWCGRQNNDPPKNVHDLISGTCEYVPLHSKRDFADVTKVSCDLGPTIFLDYLSGSNLITEAIKIEVEGRWVREMRQKKKEEKFRV